VGETFTLGELCLVDDVSSADWIVAGVRDFEHDVGSLLPVGFAAYARVFHPALRRLDGDDWAEVSWSQVAAANGRVAHASMEWIAITGEWRYLEGDAQPGIWDRAPSTGSLPNRQARALADVLRHFTEKPSECWFAVWDGIGAPAYPRPVTTVPMPQRPMALFAGPLNAVTTSFSGPLDQVAHLWWPEDRSWCVATDVDLMSTYVGASADCIAGVLEDERLESFAVTVDQRVTWDSDTVNPTPPAPPVPIALDPAASALARSNARRLPRRVTAIRTGRGDGPDDRGATMLGEVITRAFELADERREMLGTEHLLLVLAEQASTTACNILERHGLTRSAIEDILNEQRSASAPTSPP
jgi:hypothetical protein